MVFRIDFTRPLASELQRIVREQCEYALECVAQVNGPTAVESIHELRKTTKKLRALVRMSSSALPRDDQKRHRTALRRAALVLAQNRDAAVLDDSLKRAFQSIAPKSELSMQSWSHRSLFERDSGAAVRQVDAQQAQALRGILNGVVQDLLQAPELVVKADVLLDGVVKNYRRGRRLLRRAARSPTPERLHELRKRVKDQLYQLRLLVSLSPKALRREALDFDQLAQLLGEYHDLASLKRSMDASRSTWCQIVEPEGLTVWTQQRMDGLAGEALLLARRLYRTSPKSRRRRLQREHTALMRKAARGCVASSTNADEVTSTSGAPSR